MKMKRGAIISVAIILLISGGLAVLIAWLADKMKSPTFSIDQGAINGYNFTTTNIFNATFTFVIKSHNHDLKYKIKYHVVAVSVYHNEYSLGFETLGPYVQDHGDDLIFTARPVAENVFVSDGGVATAIRDETRSGQLNLDVRVRSDVKYEAKGWKKRYYIMRVRCSPLVINLTSGKTFLPTNCDVDRFR